MVITDGKCQTPHHPPPQVNSQPVGNTGYHLHLWPIENATQNELETCLQCKIHPHICLTGPNKHWKWIKTLVSSAKVKHAAHWDVLYLPWGRKHWCKTFQKKASVDYICGRGMSSQCALDQNTTCTKEFCIDKRNGEVGICIGSVFVKGSHRSAW